MKNKRIDIGFCLATPDYQNGGDSDWSLIIDENKLSEASIRDIKSQLRHAFRLGMEFKAAQIRKCLQIKENIELT